MPKNGIAEVASNIQKGKLLDDVMDEITNVWSLMGGCNNQPGPRPDNDDDDDSNNDDDNGNGKGGGSDGDTADQQPKLKRAQLI